MGLGISPLSGVMSRSQITFCHLLGDGKAEVFETPILPTTVLSDHTMSASPTQKLFGASVNVTAGRSSCSWSRPMGSTDPEYIALGTQYNQLIWAYKTTDELKMHAFGDAGTYKVDFFTGEGPVSLPKVEHQIRNFGEMIVMFFAAGCAEYVEESAFAATPILKVKKKTRNSLLSNLINPKSHNFCSLCRKRALSLLPFPFCFCVRVCSCIYRIPMR